jgi:hypothetical protein
MINEFFAGGGVFFDEIKQGAHRLVAEMSAGFQVVVDDGAHAAGQLRAFAAVDELDHRLENDIVGHLAADGAQFDVGAVEISLHFFADVFFDIPDEINTLVKINLFAFHHAVLRVAAGGIGDGTHFHQKAGGGFGGNQIDAFPLPPDVVLFGLFNQLLDFFLKFSHRNLLSDIAEATDQKNIDSLEKDIRELENNLLNYEKRRSNLLEAMELGEFGKNEILDRLNNIKHFRIEDEIKLGDLKKTRDNISSLANAKIKLNHLYNNVMDNLQDSTIEIKAMALDALEIKVYAKGNDAVEIQGIIPLELASSTTAQTSASQHGDSCPSRPA